MEPVAVYNLMFPTLQSASQQFEERTTPPLPSPEVAYDYAKPGGILTTLENELNWAPTPKGAPGSASDGGIDMTA